MQPERHTLSEEVIGSDIISRMEHILVLFGNTTDEESLRAKRQRIQSRSTQSVMNCSGEGMIRGWY